MAYLRKQNKIFHIIYFDDSGVRKSITTKTSSKSLADGMLKKFNAHRTLNLPLNLQNNHNPLFSAALDEFLATRMKRATATKQIYFFASQKWLRIVGDRPVNKYSKKDCAEFVSSLNELSINTAANYTRHLHIIFDWFLLKHYIFENPIERLDELIQEPEPIPEYQFNVICRQLFISGMFKQLDFVKLTYLCAFRISETITACYEDFDIPNKTVHVRNSKGHRIDTIVMLDDICEYVQQMKFDGKTGRIFDYRGRQSASKFWKTVNHKFHFENTIHSLRKARGSQLANAGVDILFLQDFMRHKDIRTTQKYYIKINRNKARNHINKKLETDQLEDEKDE